MGAWNPNSICSGGGECVGICLGTHPPGKQTRGGALHVITPLWVAEKDVCSGIDTFPLCDNLGPLIKKHGMT